MLRAILSSMLALALSACWVSEKDLFGPGDWSAPPGIAGSYTSENGSGDAQARVVLSVRPDGLVQGVATKIGEAEPESSVVGFVPIAGGSGKYYFLVDRSEHGRGNGGTIYLIARMTDDGFEAFWPQCAGTPDIAGMTRETQEMIDEEVCGFASKAALMKAGLAAERELEASHMFEPLPLGRMKRQKSAGEEASPEAGEEGDFTKDDAFFD